MKKNNIILEDRFDGYLKFMLVLLISVVILGITEKINLFSHHNLIPILTAMIIAFVFILVIAFSKKGIFISNQNLFKAYFFNGRLLYKFRVNNKNKNIISILNAKALPALGHSITDNLDFTNSLKIFKIFFLDKNHLERVFIISVTSKENAKRAVKFMTENFNCSYEIYNPKKK